MNTHVSHRPTGRVLLMFCFVLFCYVLCFLCIVLSEISQELEPLSDDEDVQDPMKKPSRMTMPHAYSKYVDRLRVWSLL